MSVGGEGEHNHSEGMPPNRSQAMIGLGTEQKHQAIDKDIDRRNLEIDAYHSVAFAFFAAGGGMSERKDSLLKELRERWHIPDASWNVKTRRSYSRSKSESKPNPDHPAV